jgi:uncharacterized repeat protein (TIGR01451 family)
MLKVRALAAVTLILRRRSAWARTPWPQVGRDTGRNRFRADSGTRPGGQQAPKEGQVMTTPTYPGRKRIAVFFPLVAVGAVLALAMAVAPAAQADTQLWLYPVGDNPQAGGHIVNTGSFTLQIANRGGGNSTDNIAHDVFLAIAVNDPALLTGATLELPGGEVASIDPAALQRGSPSFQCSGRSLPPHGEYPAFFTTVAIGDIAADEVVAIAVEISGADGLRVHFDAGGIGFKQAGRTIKCFDISNPAGHDVTVVLGNGGSDDCHQLAIDKVAAATGVGLGDELAYVITVTNTGTCDLTEVVVVETIPTVADGSDQLPAFTVVEVDPPATTQTDTEIVWELGTLAAGAGVTITVTVRFDQPAADGRRVVNTACAIAAELDHQQCSRAVVAVGEVGGEIGSPGFWCNQIRFARAGRSNAKFTVDELTGWLSEIEEQSAVFSELYDVSTLALAQTLLCSPNLAEDTADRLARHLLTLWVNVVSGRVDPELALSVLCPGPEEPPPGMDPAATIAAVLADAEAALVAGADDDALGFWQELIDYINNARAPGESGCTRIRRRLGGRW